MDERGKSTLSIVVQSSVGKRGHMQQLVTPPSLGSVPSRPPSVPPPTHPSLAS
jgi:hypothetical protein